MHLTPTGWLLSKKNRVTNVGKDVKKLETLYPVGGNIKWCGYGKQYGSSSKNKKYNYHMSQQFHFWIYTQKKWKQGVEQIFIYPGLQEVLFTMAKRWK